MMRFHCLAALMVGVLLVASACTPQVASHAPTPDPGLARPQTLTVLSAASLTESFTELGQLFETQNPGVKVAFSFAGSQQLAQQLGQGAGADVFASANWKSMDAVAGAGRVLPGEAAAFAANRLVIVFRNTTLLV